MLHDIIQIITAVIGSISYCIIFNIKTDKLPIIAIGSGLGWILYLIFFYFNKNKVMTLFITSLILSLFAEILARKIKTPVIVLLVPFLIPLFPGSDLYYTMYNLVTNNIDKFIYYFSIVMKEAAAISFGIILITSVIQIFFKFKKYKIIKKEIN